MPTIRIPARAMLLGSLLSAVTLAPAAHAIPAKECYSNFRAAKKAGTLNGQEYKDYKATQCGDSAAPAASTSAPPPATSAPAAKPATTQPTEPASTPPAPPAATTAPVTAGNVVFPSSVSAQYSKLSPGKARMKTCLDQYHANKNGGGNGNLKWIQKGGGYYSQCNAKLKS